MGPFSRILIIDDDYHIGDACTQILSGNGFETDWADTSRKGLELAQRVSYDLILLDLNMPDIHGTEVLRRIKQQDPDAVVIVISGFSSVHVAVDSMKLGASDFISKPFSPEELKLAVEKALENRRLSRDQFPRKHALGLRDRPSKLIGQSESMKRVREIIDLVAPTESTVFITGPSGTGKGVVASLIHEQSQRKNAPFLSVDCGSLVPTLFESELFGHVKGAFTGADQDKVGKLEIGKGGTIFFDEICNISLDMQAKLLRVVEERRFSRVGSHREIQVDVRLLAATNTDIRAEVSKGRFRDDLYYRLNVVSIDLAPLKDRKEDIPLLLEHLLRERSSRKGGRSFTVAPRAMDVLMNYPWPGNVRELENTVERLAVLCKADRITPSDLSYVGLSVHDNPGEEPISLADVEREHIRKTLLLFRGHISNTAAALGIDRKTLRQKIRRHSLG